MEGSTHGPCPGLRELKSPMGQVQRRAPGGVVWGSRQKKKTGFAGEVGRNTLQTGRSLESCCPKSAGVLSDARRAGRSGQSPLAAGGTQQALGSSLGDCPSRELRARPSPALSSGSPILHTLAGGNVKIIRRGALPRSSEVPRSKRLCRAHLVSVGLELAARAAGSRFCTHWSDLSDLADLESADCVALGYTLSR